MTRNERRFLSWPAPVVWCAITGGACASAAGAMFAAMRFGATAAAFVGGALALLAMAMLPALLARAFSRRATVPIATALLLTMAAMNAASSLTREAAFVLATGGAVLLALGCAFISRVSRVSRASVPTHRRRAQKHDMPMSTTAWLLAPALLAGLSSGLLARFQLFAICGGASGASFSHVGVSLGIVTLAGLAFDRIDRRHALLALFALRAALLAALTLDRFANSAAIAVPAFALLDFLTLPTLMRAADTASHASQAACPGIAHHAGMLAGAALATTSWGFGQGFYALFALGGALNLACACVLATPRRATPDGRYSASNPTLRSRTLELQQ